MRTLCLATLLAVAGCSSSSVKAPPPPTHEDPATVFDCLLALSTTRQILGHQSVGYQIFYDAFGSNGTGGLKGLATANAAAGVTIVPNPGSLAAIPAGGWAERPNGSNGNPTSKIDAFRDSLAPTFQGIDYLGFKFCFVDFGGSSDVTSVWNHYRSVMDTLEANPAYRGRIIHVTVPLYAASVGDVGGNTKRNEMSQHIRDTYGATGRVFDLAYFESHLDDGSACANGAVPAMCDGFSNGTGDAGHLGPAGVTRVSNAYLTFMCSVVGRQ